MTTCVPHHLWIFASAAFIAVAAVGLGFATPTYQQWRAIRATRVTEAGVADLQRHLPDAEDVQ